MNLPADQDNKHYSRCKLQGCLQDRYVERKSNGKVFVHDYCCRTHAQLYHKQKITAKQPQPHNGTSVSTSTPSNTPSKLAISAEEDDIELHLALIQSLEEVPPPAHLRTNLNNNNASSQPVMHKSKNEIMWDCPTCTFVNKVSPHGNPALQMCEMCGTAKKQINNHDNSPNNAGNCGPYSPSPPNPPVVSVARPKIPTFDDELSKAVALSLLEADNFESLARQKQSLEQQLKVRWLCDNCETENANTAKTCKQCDEPRSNDWTCPKCTFDNFPSDSHCTMCGTSSTCPNGTFNSNSVVTNTSKCGLPECHRPAVHFGFCQESHRKIGVYRRILPPSEAGVERVYVGRSGDFSAQMLMPCHDRYISVKKQFLRFWSKGTFEGAVERIFFFCPSPRIQAAFKEAAQTIGCVRRRFHGTSQSDKCFFGIDPMKPPCGRVDCNVCSISQGSFRLDHVGSGTNRLITGYLRYGPGIYFASAPGKSNDYNNGSLKIMPAQDARDQTRAWKSMFLCNVALGNAFKTQELELPPEQCPPPGYHSVLAKVGKGLQFGENVVYNEAHAMPRYLIVYSMPSEDTTV